MKRLVYLAALALIFTGCSSPKGDNPNQDGGSASVIESAGETLNCDGTERGNGAETGDPKSGAAWFADKSRTINYCMVLDAGFGITEDEAKAGIGAAFSTWAKYIESHESLSGQKEGLPTQSKLMEKCDGSEDLKFYLGTKDPGFERIAKSMQEPWAFVTRQSYDADKAWGKGYIWMSEQGRYGKIKGKLGKPTPSWNSGGALQIIATHELGHVFGTGHVDYTIMRADIVRQVNLRRSAGNIEDFQFEIDQEKQILSTGSHTGVLGKKDDLASNFELLMKRKAEGKVSATLNRISVLHFELTVKDDTEEKTFKIRADMLNSTTSCEAQQAFKVLRGSRIGFEQFSCTIQALNLEISATESLEVQILKNSGEVNAQDQQQWTENESETPTDRMNIVINDGKSQRYLFVSTY